MFFRPSNWSQIRFEFLKFLENYYNLRHSQFESFKNFQEFEFCKIGSGTKNLWHTVHSAVFLLMSWDRKPRSSSLEISGKLISKFSWSLAFISLVESSYAFILVVESSSAWTAIGSKTSRDSHFSNFIIGSDISSKFFVIGVVVVTFKLIPNSTTDFYYKLSTVNSLAFHWSQSRAAKCKILIAHIFRLLVIEKSFKFL